MRCAAAMSLVAASLESREVEVSDRLVDEPPVVGGIEHLADDALRRVDCEVSDLGADLVERAARLRLDLLARLLEPPNAIRLGLVLDASELSVADPARVGEDLRRLGLGLADQRAVLLEQLAGLYAGVVGFCDRLGDLSRRLSMAAWIGPNA